MYVIQSFSFLIICLRFCRGDFANSPILGSVHMNVNKNVNGITADYCSGDNNSVKLLVLVDSAPEQIDERNALRASWHQWWGDFSGNGTVLFFVDKPQDSEITDNLLYENDANVDMFLTVPAQSSQHSEIVRTLTWLHWVLENCKKVKFVLKLQSKALINIPAMLNFINQNQHATNTIWGNLIQTTTKYRMPYMEDITNPAYLRYANGSYLMTSDVVNKLFDGVFQSMINNDKQQSENSFLTGTIARNKQIRVVNNKQFKTMRVSDIMQVCEHMLNKQLIYLMEGNKKYLTPKYKINCEQRKKIKRN